MSTTWVPVCRLEDLTPDRGAPALVHGAQVALFRLATGELYAVDHLDPFSGAHALARGLVGDAGGRPTVASPVYKQRFDLRTGECLDDPAVRIRTWPVRAEDGIVQLGVGVLEPA